MIRAWLEGVGPVRVEVLGFSASIPGAIRVRVLKAAPGYPEGLEQHVSRDTLWDSWKRVPGTYTQIMWMDRQWLNSLWARDLRAVEVSA